jgi:hypothetical protein
MPACGESASWRSRRRAPDSSAMPTVYVRLDDGTSYAEHPTLAADTIAIGGELGTLRRAARRVPRRRTRRTFRYWQPWTVQLVPG